MRKPMIDTRETTPAMKIAIELQLPLFPDTQEAFFHNCFEPWGYFTQSGAPSVPHNEPPPTKGRKAVG